MKKLIFLLILVISLGLLTADLEINIPFSQDIIGDDHSVTGDYTYESDWFALTNTGSTTQTYSLIYTYDTAELPAGWSISLCNPLTCFIPFFSVPIELAPGASEQLSIHIHVVSTGGFAFNITLSEGDLTEPISLDFTFNTADNVDASDEILIAENSFKNFPNPFNPTTNIAFSLITGNHVDLEIYDLKGQLVRTLINEERPAGENIIYWDGRNDLGETISSGLYFYKIKAGRYTSTKKMVLMK